MKQMQYLVVAVLLMFAAPLVAAQPGDMPRDDRQGNETGNNTAEDNGPPSFVGGIVDAVTPDFLGDLFNKLPVPDFLKNWFN